MNNAKSLFECIDETFTMLDFKALAKVAALYNSKNVKNSYLYGKSNIDITLQEITEREYDGYEPSQTEYTSSYR